MTDGRFSAIFRPETTGTRVAEAPVAMSVSDFADAGAPLRCTSGFSARTVGGRPCPNCGGCSGGSGSTATRRSRLEQSGRIVAMCGPKVVGLAVYERADREVRVTKSGWTRIRRAESTASPTACLMRSNWLASPAVRGACC